MMSLCLALHIISQSVFTWPLARLWSVMSQQVCTVGCLCLPWRMFHSWAASPISCRFGYQVATRRSSKEGGKCDSRRGWLPTCGASGCITPAEYVFVLHCSAWASVKRERETEQTSSPKESLQVWLKGMEQGPAVDLGKQVKWNGSVIPVSGDRIDYNVNDT